MNLSVLKALLGMTGNAQAAGPDTVSNPDRFLNPEDYEKKKLAEGMSIKSPTPTPTPAVAAWEAIANEKGLRSNTERSEYVDAINKLLIAEGKPPLTPAEASLKGGTKF